MQNFEKIISKTFPFGDAVVAMAAAAFAAASAAAFAASWRCFFNKFDL